MVQMNQFAGQKLRHRCREQTYGHQGGESGGGGGVMNWAKKNAGEGVEKREPSCTVGGNVN